MGIDSRHPQFVKREPQWTRIGDAFEGEDAVKAKGEAYLPRLKKQEDSSYKAYVKRASFYNAVSRTVKGLVGAVMRIDPVVEDVRDDWLHDATTTGVSLQAFVAQLMERQLLFGRQGILVEHNGDRPYLVGYSTDQIINWDESFVILRETYRHMIDEYDSEYRTQYRELLLEDGIYAVRIWREEDKGAGWSVHQTIEPVNKGQRLDHIPFVPLSVDGMNLQPESPPLLPLVDMNLSHFRSSADLEHGRHFTALPTPYVTGIDAGSELSIGAETAWVLPNEGCKAGYLEFSGQGLKALEVAMEQKRSMMSSLGAQLLDNQKTGVEAEGTVRLRQNAEASVLVTSVQVVQDGLNAALLEMSEWENEAEGGVTINKDFVDTAMSAQNMTALMGAWQSGAISHNTFLWNMKRGEILPPDREIEDEKELIGLAGPAE